MTPTKDIYARQWEAEAKRFFNCLERGNYFICGDSIFVPYDDKTTASNDPRFIAYNFGDTRLNDAHFCKQYSPQLTDRQLQRIFSELQDNGVNVQDWPVYWSVYMFV